ncbi:hypothetical protein E4U55_004994 [Claviceps digitariae]|nr:hypothetical protein E4U55_004994 [Claviceps digitariae]
MDQLNLPPNTPRTMPSNSDPLMQTSPDPWMFHPHASPLSSWHIQPLPLGSLYFAHGQNSERASPDSIPVQPAHPRQHSALPHPDRSLRVLQNPDSVAGSAAAPIWAFSSHPLSGVTQYVSGAAYGMNMTSGSSASLNEPAHMSSAMRGLVPQPHSAADSESTGATSTSLSMAARLFPNSGRLRNVSDPFAASPSTILSHPPNAISPLRSTQIPSSSSQRFQRTQAYDSPTWLSMATAAALFEQRDVSGLPLPMSDRRRQTSIRTRRPAGSRQSESGFLRTYDDVEPAQNSTGESQKPTSRVYRHVSLTDDMVARQIQVFRGNASSKLVASRAAIQSLELLETCSLEENEKTCVICYNDYGVASPEGVIEVALRLPHCKHIFGDHCIKKWLEDSDSCPYCRSKLQSEPKHLHGSARTFLNMMRMRGLPLPAGLSDEVMNRLATRPITDVEFQELFLRAARTAERRPPPDDSVTQEQRRTRQRRNGPVSEEALMTDNRGGHSRPTTSDALSRQLPTMSRDFVPAEDSWAAQLTVVGSASSMPQQNRRPGIATNEGSMQQLNSMGPERGLAAAARTITQAADPAATVAMNGSLLRERTTPNPLLSRLHHSSVPSTSTSTGAYRASMMYTMENPAQRPADAELSPFQPSRIRPW